MTKREELVAACDKADVETVNDRLREALDYVQACFGAAITEGLYERLAETKDERLKDLLERRLLYGTLERMSAALASTPVVETVNDKLREQP